LARLARFRKPEYAIAGDFARRVTQLGFMVMTGGGRDHAGNEGGREQSFGLNIHLPFEQEANPIMAGDPKLINFISSPGSYFFCEKVML